MTMSNEKHKCCQLSPQKQLRQLASTMEMVLQKNQVLHKEMVGLMKEKNENDEKLVQLIGELYEISGVKGSNIEAMSRVEVDENDNDVEGVDSLTKVKSVPASLGLAGCLANIARYVLAGILSLVVEKSGLNRILGLFGATLQPVKREENIVDKRKLVVDGELDIGEDENKLKRRRCDTLDKCWLEEDIIKIKKVDLGIGEKVKALDDSYWSKKPFINFVNDKVAGIKTISDSEDLICNLSLKSNPRTKIYVEDTDQLNDTGRKLPITPSDSFEDVVMDNRLMIEPSDSFGDNINKDLTGNPMNRVETSTPLSQDQVTGLFVFSATKKPDVSEDEHAEQSMLSLMTFEEKKIYFAQKIKEEKAAALRGTNTPCKMMVDKSQGPQQYIGSRSPLPPKTGSKLTLPQLSRGNVSPFPHTEAFLTPLPLQSNRSISSPWTKEIAVKSPLKTVLPQGEPEQPLAEESRAIQTTESKGQEQSPCSESR